MSLSESDTRSKLIDPKLYKRGWTEDHIKREETAGTILPIGAKGKQRRGTTDYTLRLKIDADSQLVAVTIIEAKAETIENAVYDLKTVNPNAKDLSDKRTPAELISFINEKSKEVESALARLAKIC
jgi:type I site-specific restriction endonuclease